MSDKIYKNEQEMIEKNKHARKEILIELNQLNSERKKERKKKIIKLIIYIMVPFILFKIFIGEINISSPVQLYKNRFYTVDLNSKPIIIGIEEKKKTPIIPFIINLVEENKQTFYNAGDLREDIVFNINDKIEMSVNSYPCFSAINNKKIKISCTNANKENATNIPTDDTQYKLFIRRTNRAETVMYDGNFIKDTSNYFSEKGEYYVRISGLYDNVRTDIYFWIRII